ncbi:MAG: hypothetical protein K1X81_02810 [Bacteroidia bacterium]|nr:hypothetical protein [Bacteroidia bacterium]
MQVKFNPSKSQFTKTLVKANTILSHEVKPTFGVVKNLPVYSENIIR